MGTENISTVDIAKGTHIRSIQGLAFPQRLWVRSTILPLIRSETPSKILLIAMTEPAAREFTPITLT